VFFIKNLKKGFEIKSQVAKWIDLYFLY